MIEKIYQFWNNYSLAALLLSGVALFVAITSMKKEKSFFTYIIYVCLFIVCLVLLVTIPSGVIHVFYTETPNIIGRSLLEARDSLDESELELDEVTKQKIQEDLDVLNYIVTEQVPAGGTIIRKNETVLVDIQIRNDHASENMEEVEKGSERTQREDQSTSAPISAANASKSTTSASNAPTLTVPVTPPVLDDDTGSSNDAESSYDPGASSNNNAPTGGGMNITKDPDIGYSPADITNPPVGGGANSDSGAGNIQPQDPLTVNGNSVSDIVNGVVSDIP